MDNTPPEHSVCARLWAKHSPSSKLSIVQTRKLRLRESITEVSTTYYYFSFSKRENQGTERPCNTLRITQPTCGGRGAKANPAPTEPSKHEILDSTMSFGCPAV